ncbi:MAG: arsenate reductase ArsC [Rhodopseudomonas sp.]|nr:arsenate reductase ArsC [Rhodopseudomonas sp.]
MSDRVHNVLFLCTGNSARSIMAEAILNGLGKGQFKAYSAGTDPAGAVNPHAINILRACGYDVSSLRSKNWQEFAGSAGATDVPELDLIITVCDEAAGESCPIWPGEPMTVHWGIADPAKATGSEAEIAAAFDEAYGQLKRRIDLLLALPIAKLDRLVLSAKLKDIGRSEGATEMAKAG